MAQIFFSKDRKHIVDLLVNGVPPGRKVVSDAWDSPIICPTFKCLDTDLTVTEVINAIRQDMTWTLGYNEESLPQKDVD